MIYSTVGSFSGFNGFVRNANPNTIYVKVFVAGFASDLYSFEHNIFNNSSLDFFTSEELAKKFCSDKVINYREINLPLSKFDAIKKQILKPL